MKEKSVGAIWRKIAKSGLQYYSLSLNGVSYIAFQNKMKKTDKQPDWNIFEKKPYDAPPQADTPEAHKFLQEGEALNHAKEGVQDLPW